MPCIRVIRRPPVSGDSPRFQCPVTERSKIGIKARVLLTIISGIRHNVPPAAEKVPWTEAAWEGRERGEGKRGGRAGRERGEGERGGREGRESGERIAVRPVEQYAAPPPVDNMNQESRKTSETENVPGFWLRNMVTLLFIQIGAPLPSGFKIQDVFIVICTTMTEQSLAMKFLSLKWVI